MKDARIDLLETYILDNKTVGIDELCNKLRVSKNTVRRYLNELEKRGTVIKVYGGVKAVNSTDSQTPLSSFEDRHVARRAEKDYLCQLASELVEDNDTVFIDTGTTCVKIIEYIKELTCTIITNSLQVANMSIPYEGLNIIMLPGKLNRKTLSFVGMETIENLRSLNVDKAFMASTGVTIENGLTNASHEEYSIKKTVMSNSRSSYLLADYTKFGKTALRTYAKIENLDALITDQQPPQDIMDYCINHNVNVLF